MFKRKDCHALDPCRYLVSFMRATDNFSEADGQHKFNQVLISRLCMQPAGMQHDVILHVVNSGLVSLLSWLVL